MVKQAQRAKRVAEGHQLEIGAQRAPRFLVCDNYVWSKLFILARIKKAKIVYFQILKLQNNKITKSTELIIKSGHFPILSKNLCLI